MTCRQLFEKAKADGHDWADAAIANCANPDKKTRKTSLKELLFFAFSWVKTKEGDEYWLRIYNSLPSSNSNAIP